MSWGLRVPAAPPQASTGTWVPRYLPVTTDDEDAYGEGGYSEGLYGGELEELSGELPPAQALTGTWTARVVTPPQASTGTWVSRYLPVTTHDGGVYDDGDVYGAGVYGGDSEDLPGELPPTQALTGVWAARVSAPDQASTGTWVPRYPAPSPSSSPSYGAGAYGSGLFGH